MTTTNRDPFKPRPAGAHNLIMRNLMLMNRKHFHWLISGWWQSGYDQGYEAGLASRTAATEANR